MSMRYETEYSLGGKTWVRHRYSGPAALIAISCDLVLSLIFGLVGFALRLAWWSVLTSWFLVATVLWGVAFLLSLPFRLLRALFSPQPLPPRKPALKPAWVTLDEV